MSRGFFYRVVFFCFVSFLFSPLIVRAFEISPSVVDVSFTEGAFEVVQVFSLLHASADIRLYEAEVQLVSFAPDGSIAGFSPIFSEIGATVSPAVVEVSPGAEQIFTVTFSSPEYVSADHVFALLVRERSTQAEEILGGFVAFLFPQDVPGASAESFRIDDFGVAPSSEEDFLDVFAQFTNTGDVLVRPVSIVLVSNRFGKEIGRFPFALYEGRLPVGTTRTVSDTFFSPLFGFWHVGGPATFTLVSTPAEGGEVQRASVEIATRMGAGTLFVGIFFVFLVIGFIAFLFRKRGILCL